jgi:MFS family permease
MATGGSLVTLKDIFRDKGKAAVVLPVLLLGWVVPFCAVSFHIAFPTITRELDISTVHATWIPTAYLIAGAMIGLPIGRFVNRIGPRNGFVTAISTYIAGAVFVALSGGFRVLAISFFAMGAGSTMVVVAGRALLFRVFSTEERIRLIAVLITLISLGTLSGSFLGGVVIHFLHWRGVFWIGAVFGLCCLFMVLKRIPSGDGDPSEKTLDIAGVILYAVFIVTFLIGFSNFPHETSLFLIPFALLMLTAFIWNESRAPNPILHVKLFRENSAFRFSSLSVVIKQFSTYGIWFLMSFYLQHVNSLNPAETGIILGANAAVTAALSSVAHKLRERLGRSVMIITGLLLSTVALTMLALILTEFNLIRILIAMIILGVSTALTANTIPGLMIGNVEPKHRTMASATLNLARKMGGSMSMGTVMLFISILLGTAKLADVENHDFLICMRSILFVFAFLSTVPLIYSIIHVVRKKRQERSG